MAFGGGSPNALAPTDLVRLADALTLHLPLDTPVWSVAALFDAHRVASTRTFSSAV